VRGQNAINPFLNRVCTPYKTKLSKNIDSSYSAAEDDHAHRVSFAFRFILNKPPVHLVYLRAPSAQSTPVAFGAPYREITCHANRDLITNRSKLLLNR
jgi:hypothetical protein